ncbi:dienelactone hydrolase family protein [Xanthomonadaceae bacterium JHOS43]|nr:dienelactone hydrolase family protein [Xanthomonadaceae bacterium JHOS43]
MIPRLASLFVALGLSLPASAAMRAEAVEWTLDGAPFSGVLVYDDASDEARPGLLMVPNWMGVTERAVEHAKEIAGSRYVVLVADMYGKDVRPADATEARAQVSQLYTERPVLRARAAKALEALRENTGGAPLDAAHIGALGFCFGGTTALELARAGADVAAVVSLHGGLGTDLPATARPAASVLVLNGAADAAVSADDIAGFQREMDAVQADWQFVNYAGAVHCFAESSAASPPNCAYHPVASKRAHIAMHAFFDEAFSRGD